MNFQEATEAVKPSHGNSVCVVGKWLSTQTVDDGYEIARHIQNLREGTSKETILWLYRVCRAMEMNIAQATFYRHIEGVCKCQK